LAKNGPGTRAPEIDAPFDFFEIRSVSGNTERVEGGVFPAAPGPVGEDRNTEPSI